MEKNDHIIKHMFAGDPDKVVYDREYIEYIQEENVKLAKAKRPIHNFAPQAGFQEKVLECEAEVLIIGGRRGGGKAESVNSKVLTPFGFRRMGDLKKGDIITNPMTGGMQRVIYTYDQGLQDIYKIKFIDGTFCLCTLDHLWKVRMTNRQTKESVLNGGGIDQQWRIWTFEMIKEFFDKKEKGINKANNLLTPLCGEIKFTKSGRCMKHPDVDPYVIGVLLGDGCITGNGKISFATMDHEIFERVNASYRLSKPINAGLANSYVILDPKIKPDLDQLRILGTYSDTKFIPTCFKYGSINDRYEILAGLMDTDGTVDVDGRVSYCTVSKQLAEDVAFVVRSLGGKATITESPAGYRKETGEYVECKLSYDVYINIETQDRIFHVKRKLDRLTSYNGGVSERGRRIVGYEYYGKEEARCIKVDGVEGLFCTDDFIVTHNSAVMVLSGLYHVDNPLFIARGFRKEIGDVERGLWNTSKGIYTGVAVPAETDHRWTFPSGAQSIYDHLQNESPSVIDQRFRGVEMPHIIIDELPQIQQNTFFTLLASNRNTIGAVNKFICSCNPVPKHHWVYKMISWYIDEETRSIIPERDGKIRYFHKWGKTVDEIEWGSTKEEVYQKAKVYIDALIDPDDPEDGPDNYITSFCFIEGNYNDNKIFKSIDSSYKGRLAQQGGAQSAKDIKGIWGDVEDGEILLTRSEMEDYFFNNNFQTTGRYTAVADVALSKDFFVIYALNGGHIFDVEFFTGVLSDEAIGFIDKFLSKNHIREENFAYDSNGLGLFLEGFFKKARKFNNRATATDPKLWNNYKSECAERWVNAVKARKYSIDPNVLARKVIDKRNGITMTVAERLQAERPALQRKVTDNGRFEIIQKSDMKSIVGHSPDFIEGIFMNEIFSKGYVKVRNLGMI